MTEILQVWHCHTTLPYHILDWYVSCYTCHTASSATALEFWRLFQ